MRVVVTRAPGQAEPLASRIAELGHEVVPCPLIRIDRIGGGPVELSAYDWVVVTSANGAEELMARARGLPARFAAIGPGTAAALARAGVVADLVPAVSTQEGLLGELPRPPGRVLFAAAEGARTLIVDELGADFLPLYRTTELRPAPPAGSRRSRLGLRRPCLRRRRGPHARGLDRASDDRCRPCGGHPRDRGGAAARSRRARRCGR